MTMQQIDAARAMRTIALRHARELRLANPSFRRIPHLMARQESERSIARGWAMTEKNLRLKASIARMVGGWV